MDFAIIAAGAGSRLVADGIHISKPLVEIGGEPLIGRLIRIFLAQQATSVSVVVNEEMEDVYTYLRGLALPVSLNLVVKTTADSLHSLEMLVPFLERSGKCCLTTVDPVFDEKEFSLYLEEFRRSDDCNALMAVTTYVEDESPLYVCTDEELRITDYTSVPPRGKHYVSGGIYCLDREALLQVIPARKKGIDRMRGFQKHLVSAGLRVRAFPFSKIIDIDRSADWTEARQFVDQHRNG
ncbi:MAG: NDP-sugar synthase [Bacteroides sp.]|nr:NDP-sugar synthase [Bacteroides sp.]